MRTVVTGRLRAAILSTAGLVGLALVLFFLFAASALAHSGAGPEYDGRIPGMPDFKVEGDTTYRYIPREKQYEITRRGQPTEYTHGDFMAADSEGEMLSASVKEKLPPDELPPICRTGGNRIVILYTDYTQKHPNPVEAIRSIVRRMNWKIADQSWKSSGGARRVRMAVDCDANGNISVFNTKVSGSKPFQEPKGTSAVKYLNFDIGFIDPEEGEHGAAAWVADEKKSRENLSVVNTQSGSTITHDGKPSETTTTLHELFHMLGAVQPKAPYGGNSGAHCADQLDVMCYESNYEPCSAAKGFLTPVAFPIDCNYDTYFDAAPTSGYLVGNWNLAGIENPYLAVPPVVPPKATTGLASEIGTTRVKFNGTVIPEADYAVFYFQYVTEASYQSSGWTSARIAPSGKRGVPGYGSASVPVSHEETGLESNTAYRFRVVAVNDAGETVYGLPRTFETVGPTIRNGTATEIDAGKATLKGTVNPAGLATDYRFKWRLAGAKTYASSSAWKSLPAGSADVAVSASIGGLKGKATYEYALEAKNAEGSVESEGAEIHSFATPDWSPIVITEGIDSPMAGGAQVRISIDPQGFSTSYGVEYGLTSSYGKTVSAKDPLTGDGAQSVVVSVPGLEPETSYFFRPFATNDGNGIKQTNRGEGASLLTPRWRPIVTMASAADVRSNRASARGVVHARGLKTSFHWEYVSDLECKADEAAGSPGESSSEREDRCFEDATGVSIPSLEATYKSAFGSAGTGTDQFSVATDVAYDPTNGTIWVADDDNDRIQHVSASGAFLGQFKSCYDPASVAISPKGSVYVACASANLILRYGQEGGTGKQIASYGSGAGQVNFPLDLAFDSGGDLWIADTANNRIQKFSSEDKFIKSLPLGAGSQPWGIGVAPTGDVWVSEPNSRRISLLNQQGELVERVGSRGTGNGQFEWPSDIEVDSHGYVWVADAVNNRLQVFNEAGEFLEALGSTGTGPGQFNTEWWLRLAAGSNGDLWVTDSGNSRVERWEATFGGIESGVGEVRDSLRIESLTSKTTYHYRIIATNPEGVSTGKKTSFTTIGPATYKSAFGSAGTGTDQFSVATDVAYDPTNGTIWVADDDNDRIQHVSASGAFLGQFKSCYDPASVAISPKGSVYVACASANLILRYGQEGGTGKQIASYGSGAGQVNFPLDLAFDSGGDLWIADTANNRIQKFSSEDKFIKSLPLGAGSQPWGIGVAPTGDVWVSEPNSRRISLLNQQGELVERVGSRGTGNGQFEWPSDIEVDSHGYVWVADAVNNRLQVFNEAGEFLEALGSTGTGPGQFNTEWWLRLAAGSNGDLWVTDSGNSRVERWETGWAPLP